MGKFSFKDAHHCKAAIYSSHIVGDFFEAQPFGSILSTVTLLLEAEATNTTNVSRDYCWGVTVPAVWEEEVLLAVNEIKGQVTLNVDRIKQFP